MTRRRDAHSEPLAARRGQIIVLACLGAALMPLLACAAASAPAQPLPLAAGVGIPGFVIDRDSPRAAAEPWLLVIALADRLVVVAVPSSQWAVCPPGTPGTLSAGPSPGQLLLRRGHPQRRPPVDQGMTAAAASPPGMQGELTP